MNRYIVVYNKWGDILNKEYKCNSKEEAYEKWYKDFIEFEGKTGYSVINIISL